MNRIDSHQHFWNYSPRKHSWMLPEMKQLMRDFGPHDLAANLKKSGITGSVAVQASQTESETRFLVELAESNDFIKGVVGWVNLRSERIKERLQFFQQFPIIKGFRHVLHDEADFDFMLRPSFLNGIAALEEFGYTYDLLVYPAHLPNTIRLVERFPDQIFILDHIAKPPIHSGKLQPWQDDLAELATFPNVYCKVSGMVTETKWAAWSYEDFLPYMDVVCGLFGTSRVMFGSDWPVCLLSASYEDTFRVAAQFFSSFSERDNDKFFGMNAIKAYNL